MLTHYAYLCLLMLSHILLAEWLTHVFLLSHGLLTGGKGTLTQWVHCEFVVSFEAIRLVITQQVCGEFF